MGGTLQKLRIDTYSDASYKSESLISSKAFTVSINPTGFSRTYKIEVEKDQAIGTSTTETKYTKSHPSELQIEFLFEGTGISSSNSGNKLVNTITGKLPSTNNRTVSEQIDNFYDSTCKLQGSIHKPYNVALIWGSWEFKGMLIDFSIDYKLFSNDGAPLRASGKAKFSESISQELSAKINGMNSPDLTHKRTVKGGDTLPLMTQRIYGDSKYYLEVAKANGLVNFRQLTPGQEIYFPPIAKTS